jgi:hypothetical protein
VYLIHKTASIGQNSIWQSKIVQDMTKLYGREIIFFILKNNMDIFVFFILVLWTKSCLVVQWGTKYFCFCLVPYYLFCPVFRLKELIIFSLNNFVIDDGLWMFKNVVWNHLGSIEGFWLCLEAHRNRSLLGVSSMRKKKEKTWRKK